MTASDLALLSMCLAVPFAVLATFLLYVVVELYPT
jgi:hypothetical protein